MWTKKDEEKPCLLCQIEIETRVYVECVIYSVLFMKCILNEVDEYKL